MSAVGFHRCWNHCEAIASRVVHQLFFLSCSRGVSTHFISACERMPDREINQKSFCALKAPRIQVQLWRWAPAAGELRDDLLSFALESGLAVCLVEDVAALTVRCIRRATHFACDGVMAFGIRSFST